MSLPIPAFVDAIKAPALARIRRLQSSQQQGFWAIRAVQPFSSLFSLGLDAINPSLSPLRLARTS